MEFQREELLAKYVRLREEVVDPYVPDLDLANNTIRYVRFNDHWRALNPYSRFLIPRLMDPKDTFPKKPSNKLSKNANPANYVELHYDDEGNLKLSRIAEIEDSFLAIVYVSKQLSIEYMVTRRSDGQSSFELYDFEWCEYDEAGRLMSVEEFHTRGTPSDDVKINCEYYEYEKGVLSHAWCFENFNRFPMDYTVSMVLKMIPDRIFNPDQIEYSFSRGTEGMDYIRNRFYRKSQTITHEGHISEETLLHLAENGFYLV